MCQDIVRVGLELRCTGEDKVLGYSCTRSRPNGDESLKGTPRLGCVDDPGKNRQWVRSQRSQMTTGSQSDPRLPPQREEMLVSAPKLWSRRVR